MKERDIDLELIRMTSNQHGHRRVDFDQREKFVVRHFADLSFLQRSRKYHLQPSHSFESRITCLHWYFSPVCRVNVDAFDVPHQSGPFACSFRSQNLADFRTDICWHRIAQVQYLGRSLAVCRSGSPS